MNDMNIYQQSNKLDIQSYISIHRHERTNQHTNIRMSDAGGEHQQSGMATEENRGSMLDVPIKYPRMPSRSPSIARHIGLAQRDARSEYARYAKLDYLGNLDLEDLASFDKPRELKIDSDCVCSSYVEKDVTLVLHFDINKTIIMQDAAANKSVEDTVNDILCDFTWGTIDLASAIPTWVACQHHPSIKPPDSEGRLVASYKTFVDRYYLPYSPLRSGETKKQMIERHCTVREKRRWMVSRFTNKGYAGEMFKKFYDRLLDRLRMESVIDKSKSSQATADTAIDILDEEPPSSRPNKHSSRKDVVALTPSEDANDTYHFIIPSFFDLILHLAQQAFHDFCDGKHPHYPHVPKLLMTNRVPPHLQDSQQVAAMYRDSLDEEGTHFVVGTTLQPPVGEGLDGYKNHEQTKDLPIVHGFENIYNTISTLLQSSRVLGIRDHYEWWGMNEGRDNAGKLFLIPEFGRISNTALLSPSGSHTPNSNGAESGAESPVESQYSSSSNTNTSAVTGFMNRPPSPSQLACSNSYDACKLSQKSLRSPNLDEVNSAGSPADGMKSERSNNFLNITKSPNVTCTKPKHRGGAKIRHDIFFDDNASVVPHPNHRNIVDVRWIGGDQLGEVVDMDTFAHRYVVRVSPLMAILDPHYFIKEVHEVCRRTRHANQDRKGRSSRRSTLSGALPSTLTSELQKLCTTAL
eukprot:CFRG7197T1